MYESGGLPLLTLFTFAPVLGTLVLLLIPSRRADIIKTVAAAAAAVPMLVGFYVFWVYKDTGDMQYRESLLWIDGLNVYYRLGIDGLSAPMVVLSGLVGFVAVVASWGIEKQIKGYFALILLLLTGMNGVFVALDFFLFYVFWELMLLPMYFLIGIWGGPNRVYAAIKFFLYTMAGSVLMLVVLLACWYWSDGRYATNDVAALNRRIELRQEELGEAAAGQADVLAMQAERQTLLKALNDAREAILKRRFDAGEAIDKAGTMATETQKRRILKAYGVEWTLEIDAQLAAAHEIYPSLGSIGMSEDERGLLLAEAHIELERTFDLLELKERYGLFLGKFVLFRFLGPRSFAALMFIFLFVAFAIKVPVFPFHTWLPWAHVEAPTAISVILAGILLKMGVYGFLRVSYGLFPTMAVAYAVPIAMLGVFNILYGACCAMAQDDMKKLVAYSSVSHMGFCMLGMAALTTWGLTGSILQMFNHGTSTSMMFLLVGVLYDRAHHREINKFGGLAKVLPVYTGVMTLALFASMGLPGLSGFISEILVFLGSFRSKLGSLGGISRPEVSFQTLTVLAAIGVVLTAAYLLWMMQRVFFGPLNEKYKDYSDMNGREIFTLAPLCIVVILFGVYPQPLINLTTQTVAKLQRHVLDSRGISGSGEKDRYADADEEWIEPQAPAAAPSAPLAPRASKAKLAAQPETPADSPKAPEAAPAPSLIKETQAERPEPLTLQTGDREEEPPGKLAASR